MFLLGEVTKRYAGGPYSIRRCLMFQAEPTNTYESRYIDGGRGSDPDRGPDRLRRHPTTYPVGTEVLFLGGEAVGTCS
jgi:hypothetical protein